MWDNTTPNNCFLFSIKPIQIFLVKLYLSPFLNLNFLFLRLSTCKSPRCINHINRINLLLLDDRRDLKFLTSKLISSSYKSIGTFSDLSNRFLRISSKLLFLLIFRLLHKLHSWNTLFLSLLFGFFFFLIEVHLYYTVVVAVWLHFLIFTALLTFWVEFIFHTLGCFLSQLSFRKLAISFRITRRVALLNFLPLCGKRLPIEDRLVVGVSRLLIIHPSKAFEVLRVLSTGTVSST